MREYDSDSDSDFDSEDDEPDLLLREVGHRLCIHVSVGA